LHRQFRINSAINTAALRKVPKRSTINAGINGETENTKNLSPAVSPKSASTLEEARWCSSVWRFSNNPLSK